MEGLFPRYAAVGACRVGLVSVVGAGPGLLLPGAHGVQRLPFHRNLCLMALRSAKVNDVLAFSLNEISRQGFSDTMHASY